MQFYIFCAWAKKSKIAETVEAAAKLSFEGGRMVAVLIGQRVVGFKDWTK